MEERWDQRETKRSVNGGIKKHKLRLVNPQGTFLGHRYFHCCFGGKFCLYAGILAILNIICLVG